MHESEKWKWSCSVVSDSSRPHGLQPTRLLHPWDFPGKSTGVGCHCLLQHNGLEKAERARALHAVRLLSQWTLSQLQWQPPQEWRLPLLSPLLGLFSSSVERRGCGRGKPLSVIAYSDSFLGVIASLTPPGTFLNILYLCSWKPQRIFLEFCSQRNPPWLLGYQMF